MDIKLRFSDLTGFYSVNLFGKKTNSSNGLIYCDGLTSYRQFLLV
jgi:hypothetical protein